MSWTGGDGSQWSLSDRSDGIILAPGARGMGMPDVARFLDESPAVDGTRQRGHRVLEREVFWPLMVLHDHAGMDWLYRDRAFFATMRPDMPGQWTVTQPTGDYRTLVCRWREGSDGHDVDPAAVGWAEYEMYLAATDPWWTGAPVTETWLASAAQGYYSTSGSVYYRSPANLLGSATMSNRGDTEAWPHWRATATGDGITSCVVGVGGRVIEVPIALSSGQSVTINTAPTDRRALRENGTDVTSLLGEVDFAGIPAGEAQTLSLSMVGEGTVTATVTPRYYRAW